MDLSINRALGGVEVGGGVALDGEFDGLAFGVGRWGHRDVVVALLQRRGRWR